MGTARAAARAAARAVSKRENHAFPAKRLRVVRFFQKRTENALSPQANALSGSGYRHAKAGSVGDTEPARGALTSRRGSGLPARARGGLLRRQRLRCILKHPANASRFSGFCGMRHGRSRRGKRGDRSRAGRCPPDQESCPLWARISSTSSTPRPEFLAILAALKPFAR